MNKPNWILIGSQRSGTTSIYSYLTSHPNILPCRVKETYFFNRDYEKGQEYYESFFPATPKGFITGEATAFYLYGERTPGRIYNMYKEDVKFIVVLRNSVNRAYSHWKLEISRNKETLSFEDALRAEKKRLASNVNRGFHHFCHSYVKKGLYAEQLKRWFSIFNRSNFFIIQAENFFNNLQIVYRDLTRFLGVKDYILKDLKIHNASIDRNDMNKETRKKLVEVLKPHNEELYRLLGYTYNWR